MLTNRSMRSSAFRVLARPNRAFVFVVITTVLALILSASVPWLRGLFGFAPLGLPRLAEAAGAALVCIVVNDLIGMIWRWLAARVAAWQVATDANYRQPSDDVFGTMAGGLHRTKCIRNKPRTRPHHAKCLCRTET